MEGDSFKEYSEAAIVEKEEFHVMKPCYKEFHTYSLTWGHISSKVRTEQEEF